MEKQSTDIREVTVKVPDSKFSFFLELLAQLGMEATDDLEIPEEHKAIVLERMRTTKPEDYIPWDEARKQLKIKNQK